MSSDMSQEQASAVVNSIESAKLSPTLVSALGSTPVTSLTTIVTSKANSFINKLNSLLMVSVSIPLFFI